MAREVSNIRKVRLAALAGVAACMVVPSSASAQTAAKAEVNVASQSLGNALTQVGRQTRTEIIFSPAVVQGKRAPAVRGSLSAEEAIQRLIAGSGLKARRTASGAYVVEQNSDSSRGNGLSAAAMAAANSAAAGSAAPGEGPRTASAAIRGTSVASGVVVDARTGARLKGARVEILGTSLETATDDLGAFRIPGLRPGSYEVRISYLGYPERVETIEVGTGETATIALSTAPEIVVYGQRSARAQALNQERTAENIQTVLSADLLGQFEGTTISEALRRAPGIAFEQDPVTGDGSNVIVRGLAPDFNTVTLNGLRLPEGTGTRRSPNLSNILTDSISKVTINKSLLPSHDSSGTGGLIDIETKGPLDRPRRYASIGIEGSRAGKDFLKEFIVNGTVSATFGASDNLGLSASVQYREREIQRYNYFVANNGLFPFLPLDANGQPITSPFGIDPNRKYPFERGVDTVYPDSVSTGYNGADVSNLAVTLSGQWRVADHTQLRVDFIRSQSKRDEFARSTSFDPIEQFQLLPIDELGGEVRAALVTHDGLAAFGLPGTLLFTQQFYTFQKDVKNVTDAYSFQGKTALGPWDFNYTLGYADGTSKVPLSGRMNFYWSLSNVFNFLIPTEQLAPEAFLNVTSDGRPVSIFAPLIGDHFPVPLLNQAGFARLANEAEWELDGINGASIITGSGGNNKRYTAKGDVRRSFNSDWLKYIEAGAFFESAKFANAPLPGDQRYAILPGPGAIVTLQDLGLAFAGTSLAPIGIAGGADVVDRRDIENFFDNVSNVLANNPNLRRVDFLPDDPRRQETFTKEENLSLYIMPRVEFGKLQIVGGARFDKVRIQTRGLLDPRLIDENGVFDPGFAERYASLADGFASQTKILPRVAATFRQSEDLLFRAAYGVSVGRPLIQFLTGSQNLSFDLRPIHGPNGNQPLLTVQKTNPDLKPAITRNYDASIEKYFSDIGQIKVSFFYKSIENLIGFALSDTSTSLDDVVIPDDPRIPPASEFFVQTTQLVNGDNPGKIYGAEVALERRFNFLPGILSGFGVYANYTYTKGEREIQTVENGQNVRRKIPLSGAPKHSGTAALTYNKYGLDASLAFTKQGRRFDGFYRWGFDIYSEADSSLDFRAEYRLEPRFGKWRAYVEASDLLKGTGDADVITTQGGADGVPKIYVGGNYYGGRRVTLGLSTSF